MGGKGQLMVIVRQHETSTVLFQSSKKTGRSSSELAFHVKSTVIFHREKNFGRNREPSEMKDQEHGECVVLRMPRKVAPPRLIAQSQIAPAASPVTTSEIRTEIFNTVRYLSYERVNEVETIEDLEAILEAAVVGENARFPESIGLKEHSIRELAKTLAAWSWKNKRKPKVAIPTRNTEDALEHALAEIRVLGPHGAKVFGLLQLFRANHAGTLFTIQPERMRANRYSGGAWSVKAYKDARDKLLREGFIAIVEKERGRPVKYALADRKLTDEDRRLNGEMSKAFHAACGHDNARR
jgi:hypothetical protein